MSVMGIDPGISSAIGIIDGEEAKYFQLRAKKVKKKNEFDLEEFIEIYNTCLSSMDISVVAIEKVHTMPGQGIASSGKFMKIAGMIEGIVAHSGINYELISPVSWKKFCMPGAKKDKYESIVYAKTLYPNLEFKYKYHHNSADAILIAHYAKHKLKYK